LVSKKIEEKILDYIAKRRGLATENDVVRHIRGKLSKPPTLKLVDQLEAEGKISVLRGRKGQRHYLSINDQNRFNQIKKQLTNLEKFIKEINQYLQRRNDENNEDVYLEENEEEKTIVLSKRLDLINNLYYYYYDIFKRVLDDLFHITVTSHLSRSDSDLFLEKIIELRSKLKYLAWNKNTQKGHYRIDIVNINRLIQRFEKSGLADYMEEKQLKSKFADASIFEINNFIEQFLD
jgi:hypothetical protein